MTAAGNLLAGTVLTAAALRAVAPLAAVKPADQSVTNSATLVNDTDLALALPAAGTYYVTCELLFTCAAAAAAGIAVSFTGPSWSMGGIRQGTGGMVNDYKTSGSFACVTFGASGTGSLQLSGTAVASGPVTLQLQWAQPSGATSTTASVMKAGSVLAAWQAL